MPEAPRSLAGRGAVVTGAANGIGRAIASRLAADGATVAGVDIAEEALREVMASIGGHAVTANLRDPDGIDAAVEQAVSLLGGLSIVVNNAGVSRDAVIDELTLEDWDTVLELDLRSYFLMTKAALPALRETANAGRVINISSRAYLGNPGQANYSAAKAGVLGLTKTVLGARARPNHSQRHCSRDDRHGVCALSPQGGRDHRTCRQEHAAAAARAPGGCRWGGRLSRVRRRRIRHW
jgi:3-oxoacyl-[acyl-carrier protein] reductase